MKEKLTRNIGLKILSIILAAILWLVITNVEDPVTTKFFDNIPVQVMNEDELKKLGQVYEIIEGKTIDFTVSARRTVKENLTSSDFRVTADLANLSDLNTVTIKITCPRYGDRVTITNVSTQVMKIEREEVAEDRFSVNVKIKGEPSDNYYVYEKSVTRLLSVSGPKSKIENINQIVVEVDVTGMAKSFAIDEKPKALDEKGEEIENLNFGVDTVTAEIKMYPTKVIDLQIIPTGKPAYGYVMTTPDFEPKSIKVAGTGSALKKIDQLMIEENIEGAKENIEKVVNISDNLPEGLILVGDTQTATVDIPIVKADTKDISIWPEDIDIKNQSVNLDMAFQSIGPIMIQLVGPSEIMDEVTAKSIKPFIDLDNFTSGSYEVSVEMNLPEFVTLKNNSTVRVLLTYK